MKRVATLVALAVLAASAARAHPLSPASLELEELEAPGQFAMRWKTPRADDALTPILPASCQAIRAARGGFEAGGFVRAPAALIAVAIAMTLVWLAVELARRADAAVDRIGVVRRLLALPFGFGLLHGLGFASALGSLGVPAREIPLALAGFNVGIEVGQLALVAALLVLAALAPLFAGDPGARPHRWTALAPA